MTDRPLDAHSNASAGRPPGLAVRLFDVHKVFDSGTLAVAGVSFTAAAGEFMAIVGPSGCGKSTILRMMAGLDRPTSGSIDIVDRGRDADIAYVFQDAHLLPWRSVLRNVELPLELMGIDPRQRRRQSHDAIAAVGLADFAHAYPAQLSGGMRMRVSLARALIAHPRILLLDEPFAALDEITRQDHDDQLRALWLERRMTVVFVTHSIAEAAYLAQRVIVLTRRPARVALDRRLDLPACRGPSLRTEGGFAALCRDLGAALARGAA